MAGVGYVGLSRHAHIMRVYVYVYVCVWGCACVCACARRAIMAHKPYNPTPDGGAVR